MDWGVPSGSVPTIDFGSSCLLERGNGWWVEPGYPEVCYVVVVFVASYVVA